MLKIFSVSDAQTTLLNRVKTEMPLPESMKQGLRRIFGREVSPAEAVAEILADVRARGDIALRDWTLRIDGVSLEGLKIDRTQLAAAADRLPRELLESLTFAADRVRRFHQHQPLPSWTTTEMGGILGQKMTPLSRVGVYVPGGTAPLPSTLLMSAIPAQVAGVQDVVVVTPPQRGTGQVSDVILAAAHIAGIDTIYTLGGAQAIAALAYGTESIPRVDKIVGPGNLFVTLAKQQVFGLVGLDGLAGPTETVVIADDSADAEWVAADLIAQAEHDVLASAILFTPSTALAEKVQIEVARQMEERTRSAIIATSMQGQGGIVITRDLDEAVRLADEYAPEHMCLAVENPAKYEAMISHAGGLFIGERSFEVLGDYVAGPSHTMPTGGTARFASPLNALDFVRITSLIALDDESSAVLSEQAARIAFAEQLDGHATAALLRTESNREDPKSAKEFTRNPMSSVVNFVRPDIAAMKPYTPILPFEVLSQKLKRTPDQIVKMDANENPYGPSPKVREALARAPFMHIYPDPDSTALREELAKFTGMPVARLLAGAGADELIDLILRAVIEPGDVVIDCPPSFGMYPFSSAVNAAKYVAVPRREDFSLDIAAIEQAVKSERRAKVLFVCSPNNPDGSVINDDDLRRLLKLPVLVVLDEAYIEFAARGRLGEAGHIAWTLDYPNLVVLRTFSKLAALAGLRVGYGAFPDWLLPHLWKIKQPYNVNVAASIAALASLNDQPYLRTNVDRLVAERDRLWRKLNEFTFLKPYPTQSNFILCRVIDRDAKQLKQALEQQGVLVRYFDKPGLQNCIRISVGKPEQTDALVAALANVTSDESRGEASH
ncbi:MAG: histidinol dehydrogenase [Anaerolineae bacterium]